MPSTSTSTSTTTRSSSPRLTATTTCTPPETVVPTTALAGGSTPACPPTWMGSTTTKGTRGSGTGSSGERGTTCQRSTTPPTTGRPSKLSRWWYGRRTMLPKIKEKQSDRNRSRLRNSCYTLIVIPEKKECSKKYWTELHFSTSREHSLKMLMIKDTAQAGLM